MDQASTWPAVLLYDEAPASCRVRGRTIRRWLVSRHSTLMFAVSLCRHATDAGVQLGDNGSSLCRGG